MFYDKKWLWLVLYKLELHVVALMCPLIVRTEIRELGSMVKPLITDTDVADKLHGSN